MPSTRGPTPVVPATNYSVDAAFLNYFRCPAGGGAFDTRGELSADEGYFRFDGTICYGRRFGGPPARHITDALPDVSHAFAYQAGRLRLPFDLSEIVINLQQERYRQTSQNQLERMTSGKVPRRIYYFLRPMLPVPVRKHLQKIRLRGWDRIPFPRWPVDVSVERLMQSTMALVLKSRGLQRIPFIWFWPDGAQSCMMMTHDVEGRAGRDFCGELMDLDDAFGIKAAFQVVPETHSEKVTDLIGTFRRRGFEVNLHDLNHDGDLFRDRERFQGRAAQINQYARELGCRGFRSGSMYREQRWYDAFEFSYDMSVPNVAHLEPQRGGCCTVMPYFIGDILELPLTTTQDYTLFHILNDYSTALWKRQIESILSANGLISFITHPDYLVERRARRVYEELLAHLCRLRGDRNLWMTLPGEIDQWWRSRSRMSLAPHGESWRIEGPGSEQARLAYATLEGDHVVYMLDQSVVSR
ncbi:MAG: hypothetical protein LC804_24650 [Acidobacteria bacterium]|nr:hypothetical protein [Acidobacteriota bacterium]